MRGEREPIPDRPEGEPPLRLTPVALLAILVRRWRVVVGVAALAVLVSLLLVLIPDPRYVAESVFMPANAEEQSALSGLAAQFGVGIEVGSTSSPRFYATVLESNRVLRRLAEDSVTVLSGAEGRTEAALVELYGGVGPAEARLRRAVRQLRRDIDLAIVAGTPLLRLRTWADGPELAVALNRRLLALLDDFTIERRRDVARRERSFLEARVREARAELAAAEDALRDYVQANRAWRQSPRHELAVTRLERGIALAQELYAGLVREYDEARLEEARNTTVLTVLDPPEGSVNVAARSPTLSLALSAFLGLLLGAGAAFALEYAAAQRRRDPAAARELGRRLGRPLRRLKRRRGGVAGPGVEARDGEAPT